MFVKPRQPYIVSNVSETIETIVAIMSIVAFPEAL